MVKFGTICLEKHQVMFCSLENRYSDTYLRPFYSIWSGNLQPATNNYTMDLAFQQTKYWWLLFLHIGNTVVKFLPGLSRRSWSPATTGPPGPSVANYVAIDGPPRPSMAAMNGPPCHKWSPLRIRDCKPDRWKNRGWKYRHMT